ncbi:MAG: alpha/beta hydrolase [Alphaproteobacteria bacterium]|nr:alpha/beta hydrolase [Alphaproteobacteria bacterium]
MSAPVADGWREHDVVTGPRGLRLRVASWGAPTTSPPVVVLHGYLEQGPAWDAVAQALVARGRHVVAPDHRGHGLSEHVGAGGFYHFWDYVADVDGLLRSLGPSPVDLVGHSMGGTIAGLVAACRPDRVRRLALLEGLGPPDGTERATTNAVAYLDQLAEPRRHPSLPDLDAATARLLRAAPRLDPARARRLAARVTRPVVDGDPAVEAPEPGTLTWTWDPLHRGRSPVPFQEALHLRHLARIEAPTLLVDGEDSPYRQLDVAARVQALRHATAVVVPGAGHLLHHDAPDALADVLARFLET